MARQKKTVHRVQMTGGKRNIIRQFLEEYDIEWIIWVEIHHLSGVWKSAFRFYGNHDSGKKEIALQLWPSIEKSFGLQA